VIDRHSFNGVFSRTTWVTWHQKGKAFLDFNEADDGVAVASAGPYANHLHLAPDNNHACISLLVILRGDWHKISDDLLVPYQHRYSLNRIISLSKQMFDKKSQFTAANANEKYLCVDCKKSITTNYGQRTNGCSVNGSESKCFSIISYQCSLVWSDCLIDRRRTCSAWHCYKTNPHHHSEFTTTTTTSILRTLYRTTCVSQHPPVKNQRILLEQIFGCAELYCHATRCQVADSGKTCRYGGQLRNKQALAW